MKFIETATRVGNAPGELYPVKHIARNDGWWSADKAVYCGYEIVEGDPYKLAAMGDVCAECLVIYQALATVKLLKQELIKGDE